MLSDVDIAAELATGALRIHPLAPGAIQPASVDLHLADQFACFGGNPRWDHIDPRTPPTMDTVTVPAGRAFLLPAGGFALASTVETVTIPAHLACRYEGKSSIGRLGLATHVTAGYVDPGFTGTITLELANVAGRDILLWPGMAIGQLSLTHLRTPAARPYGTGRGSHYQGQTGPTPSAVAAQLAEAGIR